MAAAVAAKDDTEAGSEGDGDTDGDGDVGKVVSEIGESTAVGGVGEDGIGAAVEVVAGVSVVRVCN